MVMSKLCFELEMQRQRLERDRAVREGILDVIFAAWIGIDQVVGRGMPEEGSAVSHTTEEEMDACRGQVGKHPGGRPRGIVQRRLGNKEPGMCWPRPKV